MKLKLLLCVLLIYSFLQTNLKSQDFWEEVFTSGPTIFSMDISDDGIIYLGTANGIWKSFDNGDNWEFDTISTGNLVVHSLETKPEGIVYAGCNNKIYFSENFGSNWTLICNDVVISNFTALYVDNQNIIYGGIVNGMIRSEDNGSSWVQVLNINDWATTYDICEGQNGILYAAITSQMISGNSGIYHSLDNGLSWSLIGNTSTYGIQSMDLNLMGNIVAAVIWDQNWIFGGIYEFDPFENSWQCLKYGERGRAIVVNKIDNYYAGIDNELSNGGCRVSYDNGETWESINYGLSNSNIMELEIIQEGYLFCVSSFPAKVFRSIEPTFTEIIENKVSQNKTTLFPNPFTLQTRLYIKSDLRGQYEFELCDIYGNLITNSIIQLNGTQKTKIDFDTNRLIEGIYFYKIRNSSSIFSLGKLIFLNQ